ncbi:MAG: hydrolase, partial [Maribacter sp.]
MRITNLTIFTFFTSSFFLLAQDTTVVNHKRSYTTMPIMGENAPYIDGDLDDKSWEIAEWSGDFIEWEPDENTPPSQQTKFKIVYDKKYLYVAFRCFDTEPNKIEKR